MVFKKIKRKIATGSYGKLSFLAFQADLEVPFRSLINLLGIPEEIELEKNKAVELYAIEPPAYLIMMPVRNGIINGFIYSLSKKQSKRELKYLTNNTPMVLRDVINSFIEQTNSVLDNIVERYDKCEELSRYWNVSLENTFNALHHKHNLIKYSNIVLSEVSRITWRVYGIAL